MTKKNIFQIAAEFQKKIRKYADTNYPNKDSIYTIVNNIVTELKRRDPNLKNIKSVEPNISIQNTIDNKSYIYCQLIVDSNKYDQLISEPYKSEIINALKPSIEQALSTTFQAFECNIKLGIVPE